MAIEIFGINLMQALAGIGAFTLLQQLASMLFHPSSSTSSDAMGQMMVAFAQMMQMQMMLPMFQAMASMFQPKSGGGLESLLMLVGPIIAIVIILMLLKKKSS